MQKVKVDTCGLVCKMGKYIGSITATSNPLTFLGLFPVSPCFFTHLSSFSIQLSEKKIHKTLHTSTLTNPFQHLTPLHFPPLLFPTQLNVSGNFLLYLLDMPYCILTRCALLLGMPCHTFLIALRIDLSSNATDCPVLWNNQSSSPPSTVFSGPLYFLGHSSQLTPLTRLFYTHRATPRALFEKFHGLHSSFFT